MMDLHRIFLQIKGDIGRVQEVISEVLLDYVAFIAAAYNEIIEMVWNKLG